LGLKFLQVGKLSSSSRIIIRLFSKPKAFWEPTVYISNLPHPQKVVITDFGNARKTYMHVIPLGCIFIQVFS